MEKIAFSSDELPVHLDDKARFRLWRDIFHSFGCTLDVSCLPDLPFAAHFEAAQFGLMRVARFSGTVSRFERSAQILAADPDDDFCLGLNRGESAMSIQQVGREATIGRGGALLISNAEPGKVCAAAEANWFQLVIPRSVILDRLPDAEDMIARPLDHTNSALRHLRRYIDTLFGPDPIDNEPDLIAHIETTLTDLIALALGTGRDAAEIARMRGLRAARAQEVLAEIKTGIANPGFSTSMVAQKLGLSPRYIQELLQQTGRTFSERVLELRLRKARAMLSDDRHDRLKVSEIALACGFNEVSYFNRCYRRRFGASPTQYRGSNGDASG